MNQKIKKQLKSNFLRYKNDDYSYKNVFKESFDQNLPFFISVQTKLQLASSFRHELSCHWLHIK